ncbi:MAG: hypothetical protein ACKO5W_08250 [Crocinitomicaceae bacterium]
MNIMKPILFLFIVILSISCKSSREAKTKKQHVKEMKTEKKAELGDINQVSDNINILNASIEGNIINLEVSYSGGCQPHEFNLVGSTMISKSLPPIRSVVLVHKSNNDMCEKQIIETLRFDIRDFAYNQNESEIFLSIKGVENRLLYRFKP